jgi:hypothetical protein
MVFVRFFWVNNGLKMSFWVKKTLVFPTTLVAEL